MIKKTIACALGVCMLLSSVGCIHDNSDETAKYSISFKEKNGKYTVNINEGDNLISSTDYPVKIKIKNSLSEEDFTETEYEAGYDEVAGKVAVANITTANGSVFEITDTYRENTDGYKIERNVTIKNAAEGDYGFSSIYSVAVEGSQFEYFIPGMLYKDTEFSRSGTLCSDMDVERIYVRETRTGLPMAMLRNAQTGYALSLAHVNPEIKSGGVGVATNHISDGFEFGSIGYTFAEENTPIGRSRKHSKKTRSRFNRCLIAR